MPLNLIKVTTPPAALKTLIGDRQLICDFDGVLMETGLAVIDAYRKAGAKNPWLSQSMHWTEWTTEEIHERKNAIFAQRCARDCTPTPLLEFAEEHGAVVLTSCSKDAYNALKDAFKISLPVLGLGLTKEEKLIHLGKVEKPWFYIDDHIIFAEKVMKLFGQDCVAGVMRENKIPQT